MHNYSNGERLHQYDNVIKMGKDNGAEKQLQARVDLYIKYIQRVTAESPKEKED